MLKPWVLGALALTLVLIGAPTPGYAVCPVGDTIGSCPSPGPSYEGCCGDAGTVAWCENNELCELTCLNQSANELCTPQFSSCCQNCGGAVSDHRAAPPIPRRAWTVAWQVDQHHGVSV